MKLGVIDARARLLLCIRQHGDVVFYLVVGQGQLVTCVITHLL